MQPYWLVVNGVPLPEPEPQPEVILLEVQPEDPPNLTPLYTAPVTGIQFYVADRQVMRVSNEGRFFVGDREVATDEEVRDLFADWVRSFSARHGR